MKSGVKLRILTGNPTFERRDFTLGYLLFPSPIPHPPAIVLRANILQVSYHTRNSRTQQRHCESINNDTTSQL